VFCVFVWCFSYLCHECCSEYSHSSSECCCVLRYPWCVGGGGVVFHGGGVCVGVGVCPSPCISRVVGSSANGDTGASCRCYVVHGAGSLVAGYWVLGSW